MQAIVKTMYDGKEEKQVIENVTSMSRCGDNMVAVNFKDSDGRNKTQFIALDGYTEVVIR